MARPKLIRSKVLPYHVRARSNNHEWFYLPLSELWPIFCEILDVVSFKYHAHLHAFVLMSNHFHLVVSTPEGNLDAVMQYFMREVSKRIGTKTGRTNRIFGARYQRSLLEEPEYFLNAIKYVYRNPVVAKMCTRAEDYPYSSLRMWLTVSSPFPVSFEPVWLFKLLPKGNKFLSWLNTDYSEKQATIVRRGLRLSKCRWTKDRNLRNSVRGLKV